MSKKLSTIKTELSLITLAQQNGRQFLLASKNQKAADRMLMLMLAQHGMQVLTRFSPANTVQIAAALARLKRSGLSKSDELPDYNRDGFKKALANLSTIQRFAGANESADYRALIKLAFEQIDSLQVFAKFTLAAAEIATRLPELQRIPMDIANGSFDRSTLETARKHAREIHKSLTEIQPADLLVAKDLIVEGRKLLPEVKEPEIARQLTLRIKTQEGALDLFGGKMHAHIRAVLGEIVMRDNFEGSNLLVLLAKENPLNHSIFTSSEALCSMAGLAPLTIAGLVVSPSASLSADELTRESLLSFAGDQESRLAQEISRGIEFVDEKSGRPQKILLSEHLSCNSLQIVQDLAAILLSIGANKQTLSRLIGHRGQADFVKLLTSRASQLALIAGALHSADTIAIKQQKSNFVKEYFQHLGATGSPLDAMQQHQQKSGLTDDLAWALLEGEHDKLAPLLVSLARCSSSGLNYLPKNKFVEFSVRHGEASRAAALLDLQIEQFFNDGFTLRMKVGARFDVIDPRGRSSELRPSPDLSAYLQNYKAPDWLTNPKAKAGLAQIRLGELSESLLNPGEKWSSETYETGKPWDEQQHTQLVAEQFHDSARKYCPELYSAAASEFKLHIEERVANWHEDLSKDSRFLRHIDNESSDCQMLWQQAREAYLKKDVLQTDAQQELSHQKGWFRKPISERLTAIEHRILEKVELLEQNEEHPLGRLKHEADRAKQEREGLKSKLEKFGEARRLDLQKLLDYMHEKHKWPRVQLESRQNLPVNADGYQFGQGVIAFPREILFKSNKLEQILSHQLAHVFQDVQLIIYSLQKSSGDRARAKLLYEDISGQSLKDDFFFAIPAPPGRSIPSAADEARLLELASDIKQRKDNLLDRAELLQFQIWLFEARLQNLVRNKNGKGIDYLLQHIEPAGDSQSLQIFDHAVPDELTQQYRAWQERDSMSYTHSKTSTFNADAAKATAAKFLEERLAFFRQVQHELIPGLCSTGRSGAEAIAACSDFANLPTRLSQAIATAVTPYEAIAALTAAGAVKGDSLHPESRGWEAVRRMYDTKLQQGIMSTAQAKRLLALPTADREALESMLKHDRPLLSKNVFAKILQLDSRAFQNLMAVPPTICSRILVPALERGLLDAKRLDQILMLPDAQRPGAMNFLEKAVKDSNYAFTGDHLERFLALSPGGRIEIALALSGTDNNRMLSTREIALALSAPTRSSAGKEFCDAAILVKALQKGILTAEQVSEFAILDENARSGISSLLGTNGLSRETATTLMQRLQTGEISEVNARDLGLARLVGWLPDGALEEVLKLDAALRNTLFDRLAAEAPRGKPGAFSVPDFIERQAPLNEMRKQGVINEPTMRLLGIQDPADLLIWDILANQSSKNAPERVSPESIQQLVLLVRARKLDIETLEAYRFGIERGWLDRNSLRSMLTQELELKQAAETYMRFDAEMFLSLLREGRFDAMSASVNRLQNPALLVFPEIIGADGQFYIKELEALRSGPSRSRELIQFVEYMEQEDPARAIRLLIELSEGGTADSANAAATGDSDSSQAPAAAPTRSTRTTASFKLAVQHYVKIEFSEKVLSLYDLNRVHILQSLAAAIKSAAATSSDEQGNLLVHSLDPVIELAGGREFRLRDSSFVFENEEWRPCSAQEHAFIEALQNCEAGKTILAATAMVLIEKWLAAVASRAADAPTTRPGASLRTGSGSTPQSGASLRTGGGSTSQPGASLRTGGGSTAQPGASLRTGGRTTPQADPSALSKDGLSHADPSTHKVDRAGGEHSEQSAASLSNDGGSATQPGSSLRTAKESAQQPGATLRTGGNSASKPAPSPEPDRAATATSKQAPSAGQGQGFTKQPTDDEPPLDDSALEEASEPSEEDELENLLFAAEEETGAKPVNVALLNDDNFTNIRERGLAEIVFASGRKASLAMSPEQFARIEHAYNRYMHALRITSKLKGEAREKRMANLLAFFDLNCAPALKAGGVRLGESSQPYFSIIYDIQLTNKYKSKFNTPRSPVPALDLNTEQGMRKLLAEHAEGKRIYLQLASLKQSGFTPKFDPVPASGRPAKVNPQDNRKLTTSQRSALAQCIWNDDSNLYQGLFVQPKSDMLNARVELTVFKGGDTVSNSVAAFNRAEQLSYFLQILNNQKPLSEGGRKIKELLAADEFEQLNCSDETLISSNDFMQTLRELEIIPDKSLWQASDQYRQEVEERLAKDRPAASESWTASLYSKAGEAEAELDETPLKFERGEPLIYFAEKHRLIGIIENFNEPQAENAEEQPEPTNELLIYYDDPAREMSASQIMPISDEELAEQYEMSANSQIHLINRKANRHIVYVLSCDHEDNKFIHIDPLMHCVPAELVQEVSEVQLPDEGLEVSLGKLLCAKAREIFDNYKEFSLSVDGQQKPLPFKQVIVGRGNDAGIKILDEANYVGTRHLQILVTPREVSLQDLNSKNGSYLNGERIPPYETIRLRTTDRVTLGAPDGPLVSLIYQPTEKSKAPEYNYFVGDKILTPGAYPLIIGRLATADAFVSDQTVSKIQASVRMTVAGKVMLKDGGAKPSSNGLVINGEQITPGSEVELNPGDKVATRTGVILPITYEKKRSRFALLVETGSGRVNIKDANLAGLPVFLGVDPRHGVYALPKSNDTWIMKPKSKNMGHQSFMLRTQGKSAAGSAHGRQEIDGASKEKLPRFMYAAGLVANEAIKQSNFFAQHNYCETRIEEGWASVSKGKLFEADGNFEAKNRLATVVDRKQDPILKAVIEDSRRRFWHLSPEMRARSLSEYVRELFTPTYFNSEALDRWYNQFCHDHSNKRVLLGEFIKEGKGICTQQAILLKVLADEFSDMPCKLVRGMDGCHMWTTIMLSGKEVIHDPRGRFISPVPGESGALPQAVHWIPDSETSKSEFAHETYVKVGDSVSFDGSSGWKVSSYDTLAGDILLCCDGSRSVSSADLALANPDRLLKLGEKYEVPREDGYLDRGRRSWTFEGINSDGTLRLFRSDAIEVMARLDQVRLRSGRDARAPGNATSGRSVDT